jgi:hypothetical protein
MCFLIRYTSLAQCALPRRLAGAYRAHVLERDKRDGLIIFCRYERPVGLLITLYVHIVYKVALRFEGCADFPFICHVRSSDTAKTVHRHDLFQAVDIFQKIWQRAVKQRSPHLWLSTAIMTLTPTCETRFNDT